MSLINQFRLLLPFRTPKLASLLVALIGIQLLSLKTATIFGQGTIPEPSTPHIGKEVVLVARTAAFVYK